MPQHREDDFYEIAGHQQDKRERERASKLLIRTGFTAISPLVIVWIIYMIPHSMETKKTSFARFSEPTEKSIEDRALSLRVLSSKRQQEVDSRFFLNSKPRDGFVFQVVEVELQNPTDNPQKVTPFSFGVFTKDGTLYRTHIATHNHPKRLKTSTLDPREKTRGIIVFQLPITAHPKSIEIMAAGGPRGRSNL